jgi:predicted ester cyclase
MPPDREGVKQFFTQMRTAFPDLHVEPVVIMEEGDRVIARFHMTGTHEGDFAGLPPTGRRVAIDGYDEVRIVGDRAAEHWGAMDGLVLMRQLGAVPEGAPAG